MKSMVALFPCGITVQRIWNTRTSPVGSWFLVPPDGTPLRRIIRHVYRPGSSAMNLTDSGTRAVSTINMFSNSHFFRKNDRATVQPVALQNGDFCIVSCKSGVHSVLLRCWLGDRKGILPVKTLFQQSQCSLQVLRDGLGLTWCDLRKVDRINNKKFSWCWQTRATRLEVSQGHQNRSIC